MIGCVNHISCLDGLQHLDPGSVDFVFADLPYGTTQQNWDQRVPMDALWPLLAVVCKPDAAMVFTAAQPFSSLLVVSRLDWFKYEVVWRKNKSTGFLNAKKQPLRAHESCLVFYREQPAYEPQMTDGHELGHAVKGRVSKTELYGGHAQPRAWGGSTKRYPTTVLEIPVVNADAKHRIHRNQKPVELAARFIRTYTKPGDLVLDPTAGSGSALVAAKMLGRRFVGFETNAGYCEKANAWLESTVFHKDYQLGKLRG